MSMKCIHGVEGDGVIEVRRSNCYACQKEAAEPDRLRKVVEFLSCNSVEIVPHKDGSVELYVDRATSPDEESNHIFAPTLFDAIEEVRHRAKEGRMSETNVCTAEGKTSSWKCVTCGYDGKIAIREDDTPYMNSFHCEVCFLRAALSQVQKELAEKEERLRDWERSSAESCTVLVRNERYNELLAIEAKVEDVEGTVKLLARGERLSADKDLSIEDWIRSPRFIRDVYMLRALIMRNFLKGGGG